MSLFFKLFFKKELLSVPSWRALHAKLVSRDPSGRVYVSVWPATASQDDSIEKKMRTGVFRCNEESLILSPKEKLHTCGSCKMGV